MTVSSSILYSQSSNRFLILDQRRTAAKQAKQSQYFPFPSKVNSSKSTVISPPANSQAHENAATKIQAVARSFRVRHSKIDGISLATRSRIIEHMRRLADHISFSPSAIAFNDQHQDRHLTQQEYRDYLKFIAIKNVPHNWQQLRSFFKAGYGNCLEMARFLFIMLLNDPAIPEDFKQKLEIVRLAKPNDHAFLRMGTLIIDPWLALCDLYTTQGLRKYDIKAKSTTQFSMPMHPAHIQLERNRGFIGPEEDYLSLMTTCVDGEYIFADIKPSISHTNNNYTGEMQRNFRYYKAMLPRKLDVRHTPIHTRYDK